jgi:hypothetical protein
VNGARTSAAKLLPGGCGRSRPTTLGAVMTRSGLQRALGRPQRIAVGVLAVGVLTLAAGACSSHGGASGTSVVAYNASRHGYTDAGNRVARGIADQIVAGRIVCTGYRESPFGALQLTYAKQKVPLPLGSGECDGGPARENVLIEVFRAASPNAADFIGRKAVLICRRGLELGKRPDGSNVFPGLPYVAAADHTWLVEPDSVAFAQQIGAVLGRPARDACASYRHSK